ncbi:hypothetical protein ACOZ3J_02805 [Weissella koreensis]|uniref:Uncharacterized protein n=2 Tax=Weissella koreensis TaxID=165096 RepID=A0A7H1ML91_9LACO|nr:hypothetical protein [Weissella koreensis]AVH75023.1 hypothetical protein C4597_02870 [Weissella koreensis]QGN20249.1 hypothetical protein GKC51_02855 [Weissella koreensis]QNT64227.1 hypothetical protein FY536_02575 [Weissella koreensis]
METRVDKNKKSKKWIYIVLAIIIIIIGMIVFLHNIGSNISSKHNDTELTRSSNHVDTKLKKKQVNKNNLNDVKNKLVGMNLTISPYLYDGEAVDDAMNNGDAPQNLVHDGTNNVSFIDENTMRSKMLGSYNTENYSVTKKYIIINKNDNISGKIPYKFENDEITFKQWDSTSDGHKITWQATISDNIVSDNSDNEVSSDSKGDVSSTSESESQSENNPIKTNDFNKTDLTNRLIGIWQDDQGNKLKITGSSETNYYGAGSAENGPGGFAIGTMDDGSNSENREFKAIAGQQYSPDQTPGSITFSEDYNTVTFVNVMPGSGSQKYTRAQ